MAIMARPPKVPPLVFADDKIRQSMHDANLTVEHAEKTVARVHRHILRCDALLRRLRLLAERRLKR